MTIARSEIVQNSQNHQNCSLFLCGCDVNVGCHTHANFTSHSRKASMPFLSNWACLYLSSWWWFKWERREEPKKQLNELLPQIMPKENKTRDFFFSKWVHTLSVPITNNSLVCRHWTQHEKNWGWIMSSPMLTCSGMACQMACTVSSTLQQVAGNYLYLLRHGRAGALGERNRWISGFTWEGQVEGRTGMGPSDTGTCQILILFPIPSLSPIFLGLAPAK